MICIFVVGTITTTKCLKLYPPTVRYANFEKNSATYCYSNAKNTNISGTKMSHIVCDVMNIVIDIFTNIVTNIVTNVVTNSFSEWCKTSPSTAFGG